MLTNELCAQITERLSISEKLYSNYMATCVINALLCVVATGTNAVIITAIVKTRALHKPSYVFICTLAISDLCVGLVVQPLFIAYHAVEIAGSHGHLCNLGIAYNFLAPAMAGLSFFTVIAISIDRLLAVTLQLGYRTTVTTQRTMAIGLLFFVLSHAVAFTIFKTAAYYVTACFVGFIFMVITSSTYYRIFKILRQHHNKIRAHSQTLQVNQCQRRSFNSTRQRKVVLSMIYVYVAFLMCYLPYLCCLAALVVSGRTITIHGAFQVAHTLIFLNSSLNPALYYWRMPQIRRAVRHALRMR